MEISHQPKIYDSNFLKLIDFLSTNLTEADEQEIQQGIEYVLRNFRQSEVKATFLKFGSIFDTFDKLKNYIKPELASSVIADFYSGVEAKQFPVSIMVIKALARILNEKLDDKNTDKSVIDQVVKNLLICPHTGEYGKTQEFLLLLKCVGRCSDEIENEIRSAAKLADEILSQTQPTVWSATNLNHLHEDYLPRTFQNSLDYLNTNLSSNADLASAFILVLGEIDPKIVKDYIWIAIKHPEAARKFLEEAMEHTEILTEAAWYEEVLDYANYIVDEATQTYVNNGRSYFFPDVPYLALVDKENFIWEVNYPDALASNGCIVFFREISMVGSVPESLRYDIHFLPFDSTRYQDDFNALKIMRMGRNGLLNIIKRLQESTQNVQIVFKGRTNARMARIAMHVGFKLVDAKEEDLKEAIKNDRETSVFDVIASSDEILSAIRGKRITKLLDRTSKKHDLLTN